MAYVSWVNNWISVPLMRSISLLLLLLMLIISRVSFHFTPSCTSYFFMWYDLRMRLNSRLNRKIRLFYLESNQICCWISGLKFIRASNSNIRKSFVFVMLCIRNKKLRSTDVCRCSFQQKDVPSYTWRKFIGTNVRLEFPALDSTGHCWPIDPDMC